MGYFKRKVTFCVWLLDLPKRMTNIVIGYFLILWVETTLQLWSWLWEFKIIRQQSLNAQWPKANSNPNMYWSVLILAALTCQHCGSLGFEQTAWVLCTMQAVRPHTPVKAVQTSWLCLLWIAVVCLCIQSSLFLQKHNGSVMENRFFS